MITAIGGTTVIGSLFTQIPSGGIIVGGYRADAHHPSDVRMKNQNITVSTKKPRTSPRGRAARPHPERRPHMHTSRRLAARLTAT
ncbi:hypothetical protein ACFT1B_35225, partial [Streptomyces griseoincarnatus]